MKPGSALLTIGMIVGAWGGYLLSVVAEGGEVANTRSPDPNLALVAEPNTGVVGYINGQPITQDQWDQACQLVIKRLPPHQPLTEDIRRECRTHGFDLLVETIVLADLAGKKGLVLSPADYEKEYQDQIAKNATANGIPPEDFIRQMEARSGMTFDQMKTQAVSDVFYRNVVLRDKLIRLRVAEESYISDEEIQAFYMEQLEIRFDVPEKVDISHILIATMDLETGRPKSTEEQAQAKSKAEMVLQQVLADPNGFVELAKKYSDCGSGPFEGNIGAYPRDGRQAEPEVIKAAFTLSPSEIYHGLVQSRLGYHIVKTRYLVPPINIPLEEARETIRQDIMDRRVSDIKRQFHPALLRQSAQIKRFDDQPPL